MNKFRGFPKFNFLDFDKFEFSIILGYVRNFTFQDFRRVTKHGPRAQVALKFLIRSTTDTSTKSIPLCFDINGN